jgi:spore coat polysaccharide biosynthesis protein SpsF (cytidylyltransferase family)
MSMKRVCVVQARMGSTRLPGKVLRDLAGRPMLAQQLRRLRTCRSLDDIVIATSSSTSDDPIAQAGASEGVQVFRGSETDVLGRVLGAARAARADIVVRVTGDCPLLDPAVTDRVVDELATHSGVADYASNVVHRTFPRGLDVEALFLDALVRVDRLGLTQAEREHVTITIRSEQPGLFLTRSVESETDDSDLRWTVDEERDLQLISQLYDTLQLGERILPYQIVVDHVRRHPELAGVNAGVATWTPRTKSRD